MEELHAETPTLLRCKDVQKRTGLPRSTIYKLIAKKGFPAPVRLTQRAVGWHKSSVDEWITTRATTAAI
jgi:prophage regulatory protein